MTKEVLIKISGLQKMTEDEDEIEIIVSGEYFFKNGKHYLIYEEMMEGFEGSVRNTVKISRDQVDIRKNGIANTHMVFEQDTKNLTCYATPMGEMAIGIETKDIEVEEKEDQLKVTIAYGLEINYEHISDCNLTMDVSSKNKAILSL